MKKIEVDVLVVGSGAGGLASAVCSAHRGLKVVVAEKERVFGGTTARSGGWLWIPNNSLGKKAGFEDSLDKARTYLKHEAGKHYDSARVEAFLEAGPKAVDFFEKETELQFDLGPTFADYHCTAPGGMDAGRSIVARPFNGRELGKEIKRLRPPLWEITMLGMMIGSGKELLHFFNVTKSPISMFFVIGLVLKFFRDVIFHGRAMRLMNGNALVARLAKSAFNKGVPIWTSSPVASLIRNENQEVIGAVVNKPDGPVQVMTRKGVVLAAGGFPQDPVRRKQLMPHAPSGHEHVSPAPPGNTGDGLRMAESVGGQVETEYPHAAAWVPISRPPAANGLQGTFPHFVDRSKPGIIAITRSGKRFVNEAQSYHDFCQAMIKRCQEEGGAGAENAAWFIADHRTFRKYGIGYAKPSPVPYGNLIKKGYLIRGNTLRDLADQIGADGAQLEKTVAEFNRHAVNGEDPEFGKGSTAYNRSLGDPAHKPNPCVAPVKQGPFYAVRLYVGDLGTFAGIKTNQDAQVIDASGQPIKGLYAAGNDNASIMGGNYPGGGITLGPACTFGYIAARHMAGANS